MQQVWGTKKLHIGMMKNSDIYSELHWRILQETLNLTITFQNYIWGYTSNS